VAIWHLKYFHHFNRVLIHLIAYDRLDLYAIELLLYAIEIRTIHVVKNNFHNSSFEFIDIFASEPGESRSGCPALSGATLSP
jgi:hypothetical protein